MIENERQYQVTKAAAAKFKLALDSVAANDDPAIHPIMKQAQMDALQSQYDELCEQIAEYETRTTA